MYKLLLFASLFSCATQQKSDFTPTPNKKFWIGKPEEKLALHPVFATMPVESRETPAKVQTRRYSSGAITSDDCKGNQCEGYANPYACNHVFYIKNSIITNYLRVGNCGPEDPTFRPLDENGNPELSRVELEQLKKIGDATHEPVGECKSRKDCPEKDMSCKITYSESQTGICVNGGMFGRLFYK